MKRFFALILAAAVIFPLSSCSDGGRNKNIRYALRASPSTLDPQYAKETDAQIIINNAFEGLVRVSGDGEVVPGIASRWEISDDGLTYTFFLKPGTEWYCPLALKKERGEDFYKKFSTEKVTAADFVFAMRRLASPKTKSRYANRLFAVKNAPEINAGKLGVEELGAEAADDNTLVVRLSERSPDMLQRFAESEFMPCNEEFFNSMRGRYGLSSKHILCNGPFYVSAWDRESSLTIKRNKFYAGEREVLPLSASFCFDPDAESVAGKISAGEINAAVLPADCETPENCRVVRETKNSVFGFCFNCSDPSLKNEKARLALCKSIDAGLFSETEGEIPAAGVAPESCFAGSKNYREAAGGRAPGLKFDLREASELWRAALEELAVEKIFVKVVCPERFDGAVRRQLQLWQKTMGVSLGIVVENKTAAEITAAAASGNYQIALTILESRYENATDFFASFEDGGIFRFPASEYNAVIKKLLASGSDGEILEGCLAAETYILKKGIFYPLYSRSNRFVVSKNTEGITVGKTESSISFIGAKRYD